MAEYEVIDAEGDSNCLSGSVRATIKELYGKTEIQNENLAFANVSKIVSKDENGTIVEEVVFPSEITSLDSFGASLNETVCNYIDFENQKYYQRCKVIDLGKVPFLYNDTFQIFRGNFDEHTVVSRKPGITNLLCGKLTQKSTGVWTQTSDGEYFGWKDTTEIDFKDLTKTTDDLINKDASGFGYAPWLDGVYMVVECESTIETNISYSPDIKVVENGVLTFVSDVAPSSKIAYAIGDDTGDSYVPETEIKRINGRSLCDVSARETLLRVESWMDKFKNCILSPLVNTRFVKQETDWGYDNCTASNGLSLISNSKAYLNKYLAFDKWCAKATVRINDLTSVFGFTVEKTSLVAVGGAVFLVDVPNNKIKLFKGYAWDYALPDSVAEKEIDFTLATGKDYIIEVFHSGLSFAFSIKNSETMEKSTVYFDNEATGYVADNMAGMGHGGIGVICVSGDVFVKNFVYSTEHAKKTKCLFIGDSITERPVTTNGTSKRWCTLLRDELFNGDAIISGRSNGVSYDAKKRLEDMISLGISAEVVILLIGTNERISTDKVEQWKSSVDSIVSTIQSAGALPIVCVPPLAGSYVSNLLLMRDYILSKGWNTIRFDIATSIDRAGTEIDSTLFNDSLHPNEYGSRRMFEQAMFDLCTN